MGTSSWDHSMYTTAQTAEMGPHTSTDRERAGTKHTLPTTQQGQQDSTHGHAILLTCMHAQQAPNCKQSTAVEGFARSSVTTTRPCRGSLLNKSPLCHCACKHRRLSKAYILMITYRCIHMACSVSEGASTAQGDCTPIHPAAHHPTMPPHHSSTTAQHSTPPPPAAAHHASSDPGPTPHGRESLSGHTCTTHLHGGHTCCTSLKTQQLSSSYSQFRRAAHHWGTRQACTAHPHSTLARNKHQQPACTHTPKTAAAAGAGMQQAAASMQGSSCTA